MVIPAFSWQAKTAAKYPTDDDPPFDAYALGPPVPTPGQVFAIGLNYKDHAGEANIPIPE